MALCHNKSAYFRSLLCIVSLLQLFTQECQPLCYGYTQKLVSGLTSGSHEICLFIVVEVT